MNFTKNQRAALLLIITAFFILGVIYAWVTPPLESSDEYKHYPFVQYVQTMAKLPVLDPQNPGLWLQEAAQPPLYYILMALATSRIDTSDLPEVHHKNQQAFIGNPGQVGNKNLIVHDPARETFPWRGTILAIFTIRLLSLFLSAGTVLISTRLGQLLFNSRVGLLAAALTAFNPMFLFVSAAVNNDSLAILLGSLGLLLIVQIWQAEPDLSASWWRYLLLGCVIGLGVLTKLSLAGLLVPAGLSLLLLSWRSRKWSRLFAGGLLIIVPVLLLSGWWFARNWTLYGDPTGLSAFIAVQGSREIPLSWDGWLDEWGTFYRSFWGLFGGVNVSAPEWFYWLMNGFAVFAALGFLKWLWQKEARQHFFTSGTWLAAVWVLIIFLLLIRWNIISPAFQGRLLFPALGALNVLWAVGLLAWLKEAWRTKLALGISSGLFLIAFFLPFLSIRPVYALPRPLTAVPPQARIDPVIFRDGQGQLRLVGVDMAEDQDVKPGGDPIAVTLYWQMDEPVAIDYISSVHLLGRELESVGQIDRYPAMGLIPTSRWQAGNIFRDSYHVYVEDTAEVPAQLRAAVSLYDDASDQTLTAQNSADMTIDPVFVGPPARLSAVRENLPSMETQLNALFEQGIRLVGVSGLSGSPGETIPLILYWQAESIPDKDYTVFVHLLDGQGSRITGADSPPVNNYFPTSMWRPGDLIDDTHWLPIPEDLAPGKYKVIAGLYDPVSGLRLAQLGGSGDHASMTLVVEGN